MLWTEKYRPESLENVIGNEQIRNTIMQFIQKNQLPHLILHGGPGLGKTTTIRALIKSICTRQQSNSNFIGNQHVTYSNTVLQLNASDDRSIKTVREEIADFVSSSSIEQNIMTLSDLIKKDDKKHNASQLNNDLKLVILEEVDSFTSDAQFCLRGLLELHAYCARFMMTCNDISRLLPTLRSRCCEFYFRPLRQHEIHNHLSYILRMESVNISDWQLRNIITLADGDLRKAIAALQSSAKPFQQLPHAEILTSLPHQKLYECNNDIDVFKFLKKFRGENDMDLEQMVKQISNLRSNPRDTLKKTVTFSSDFVLEKKTLPRVSSKKTHKDIICFDDTSNSLPIFLTDLTGMIDKGLFPDIGLTILSVYWKIITE